jgi:cytoskeletal protein RodZ
MPKKAEAAVANPAKQPVSKAADEEPLPWYGQLVNHILTPGSSLTVGVWNLFNALLLTLFLIWLMFFYHFPTSIHTWVFLVLGAGLAASTNWFMREIFAAKEDFASVKEREASEAEKKGADATAAAATTTTSVEPNAATKNEATTKPPVAPTAPAPEASKSPQAKKKAAQIKKLA